MGAQYVILYTFNKPSTDFNMQRHAFCVITTLYGFFSFPMLCLHMKHFRDGMDEDDRGRLKRIVAKIYAVVKITWVPC